ncbi:MAG: thiamine-phosphate kinase [Salinivirgaceae bacterium]|nr:thiamine-phosphate kinase [Salinivirgaceae bacterium]MDD4746208.1 thiamine-phosphate kinase [Salinivirgaceae bacterium]MDY0279369.1 thiamine-phosphate kinase [Salinivirgaceae bacterium]
MEHKLTDIKEIGEFGLIKRIAASTKLRNIETIKGIGDDAAVIQCNGDRIVITTDMLIEGVHFDLTYMPLIHLGYKAVAVNLSDIFAMNAIPKQITVSIGLSSKFSVEHVDEIYKGISKACELYQVDLVGGDTVASPNGLVISITAIGTVSDDQITYRNGAKANDLICVTGDLGAAYLGLKLLAREKEVFEINPNEQPQLIGYEYLIERQLKPEPRQDIVVKLKELDILPTSMIDVSDGLSSELMHICQSSAKGCRIYDDKIPIHPQSVALSDEFMIEPIIPALNGGEDYELLFTVDQKHFEKVKSMENVSIIGHITNVEGQYEIVFQDGTVLPLSAQGWNAFTEE